MRGGLGLFVWEGTDRSEIQRVCVDRMHPPLTELNQCAFPCDSYLMFEPSRQQRCTTTLRAFVLRTKPHFSSTLFFVSVWYKGQVVQFEQKAEISTESRDIGKNSNCFAYRIRSLLLLKVFIWPDWASKVPYLPRFADYPTIGLRVLLHQGPST